MDLNSFKNHGVRSIGSIFTILISTFVLAACGGGVQESVTTGVGSASKPVSQASEAASGSINVYQTGQRVMATLADPKIPGSDQELGGANSRNEALTVVLFTQQAGVHGTLVGSLIEGSAGEFTGNWVSVQPTHNLSLMRRHDVGAGMNETIVPLGISFNSYKPNGV